MNGLSRRARHSPAAPAVLRYRKIGKPSEREAEVARLTAAGHGNKEIAGRLDLSVKTVETYRARSLEKLGLNSRAELVRYAFQQGWLAGRAEDTQATLLELVHDPGDQRDLRSDHGQVDAVLNRKIQQAVVVGNRQWDTLSQLRDPGIPRGAVDFTDLLALRQFPDQRMLAPASSDDQNLQHELSFLEARRLISAR